VREFVKKREKVILKKRKICTPELLVAGNPLEIKHIQEPPAAQGEQEVIVRH
jgi:hypothetical protein